MKTKAAAPAHIMLSSSAFAATRHVSLSGSGTAPCTNGSAATTDFPSSASTHFNR